MRDDVSEVVAHSLIWVVAIVCATVLILMGHGEAIIVLVGIAFFGFLFFG